MRAFDMEALSIKQSSTTTNSSRLKLIELLHRIQEAGKQTTQKLDDNQEEQTSLEARANIMTKA